MIHKRVATPANTMLIVFPRLKSAYRYENRREGGLVHPDKVRPLVDLVVSLTWTIIRPVDLKKIKAIKEEGRLVSTTLNTTYLNLSSFT